MKSTAMFSSSTDLWSTPSDLFNKLDAEFSFNTDVCATRENAKCNHFFSQQEDGLSQEWRGTCWMNPPYGRQIRKWVEKAHASAKNNKATVVCLVPARVDTSWWHDFCKNAEVFFLKGRLKFGTATNSAPFPSAIVVFRPSVHSALGLKYSNTSQ